MILLALLGYIYQLERAWVILLPLLVLFVVIMVFTAVRIAERIFGGFPANFAISAVRH